MLAEKSLGSYTYRVDGNAQVYEHRAVKLDTAAGENYVDKPAAGDDGVVGIIATGNTRTTTQQGNGQDHISVHSLIYGSIVWWEAGEEITIGDDLETDANGRAIVIDDAATDEWSFRIAIALEAAAAAGNVIAVFLAPGYILK